MSSPRSLLLLLLLFSTALVAQQPGSAASQSRHASKKTRPAKTDQTEIKPVEIGQVDYSEEPYVFELYKEAWRFENDGTGTREQSARIRVQSEAGVQALGQLIFGYNSANERMEIQYARVRKPDGTVLTAPLDSAQDLPSPIEREAPVYTDFREKHFTVPGLRPGETLEYSVRTITETPLVAGQFWLSHDFEKRAIVLDEEMEIDVPRGREIKLKTQPGSEAKVEDAGDRRIYRWTSAHLERDKDENKAAKKKKSGEDRPPAIQLTTFSSWPEVGKWYAALEKDRVAPTAEVRAKAEELTRGKKTDMEKIEALYDYVSSDFRYVSLSFGTGRLQPHPAASILANQYGDCKDKHTLLASLLESIGIKTDAVLIHSQRKLDPDVPAPSQFDHMITAIPQSGGDYIWLDSTNQVAPFRMLLQNLRGKQAVVIGEDGSARVVETPDDPPFLNTADVSITGKVTELGKLEATVQQRVRGDQEILLRYLFRNTPQHKWEALAQQVAGWFGLRGDVTEVKASDASNTKQPFELSYKIALSGYVDWSSKQSQPYVFMPSVSMPDVDADAQDAPEAIKIGSPAEVQETLRLELPEKFTVRLPVPFSVKRDYAEYSAKYAMDGHTFTAQREIRVKMRELPSSRARDYANFRQNMRADEDQKLTMESQLAGTPEGLKDAKPDDLFEAAMASLRSQNYETSLQLLQRVVKLEPKHKDAWSELGRIYLVLNRPEEAIQALQKQVEVEPYHESAYSMMGVAYWRQQKYAEATTAFQKQIEMNPLDDFAHASLGEMYCEWHKYEDAVPELEKAISLRPDNATLYASLGQAYLNLDQPEKARRTMDKAVELAPTPTTWNNVAYQLAEKGVNLDRAQQYAESAVAAVAASLRNVSLDRVRIQDAGLVAGLGAYWDTLGWVHYKKGDLLSAEKYVGASWQLMQHGEVGDHLGQIYEKQGRKPDAIRMYAMAMAAYRPVPETRARLGKLLGGDKKVDAEVAKVRPQVESLRSVQVPSLAKDAATADFLVLMSGAKVEEVKFLNGDNKLQALAEALRTAKIGELLPDETPTKIIRRGTMSCAAGKPECTFTMQQPDIVSSVN